LELCNTLIPDTFPDETVDFGESRT